MLTFVARQIFIHLLSMVVVLLWQYVARLQAVQEAVASSVIEVLWTHLQNLEVPVQIKYLILILM